MWTHIYKLLKGYLLLLIHSWTVGTSDFWMDHGAGGFPEMGKPSHPGGEPQQTVEDVHVEKMVIYLALEMLINNYV